MTLTPDEFRQAREQLNLTPPELAEALGVTDRTIRGWERGDRDGRPNPVPRAVAVLIQLACIYPRARRMLGIDGKPKAVKSKPAEA